MDILSWNIQAAKGVDNVVSVERIAHDIKQLSDADIICLQEVLITPDANQAEQLSQHFPQHTPIFGAAINRLDNNGRLQFGNLILCRLPVLQIVQHKLPQPAEPSAKHMPRQAIEIIANFNQNPLRVVTTHLDYFAAQQRSAQVKYLVTHHQECLKRHQHPSPTGGQMQFQSMEETAASIYCGDFNLPVGSEDYKSMTSAINAPSDSALIDCWTKLNRAEPHLPTCGIFDHVQWQEGAHCRDFFFASHAIAPRVSAINVDIQTAASDHQPLTITLE